MKSKLPEGVTEILVTQKQSVFLDGLAAHEKEMKLYPIYARIKKDREARECDPTRKLDTFEKVAARILTYNKAVFFDALYEIDNQIKQHTPKELGGQSFFDDPYLAQWEFF